MADKDRAYMTLALQVAEKALNVGEVPVGCVIVDNRLDVVVSHGANQVNATRDASRHAEIVAIDRMLTKGVSSDELMLPADVYAKPAHRHALPADSPLAAMSTSELQDYLRDEWKPQYDGKYGWKKEYGWRRNQNLYDAKDLASCTLYVTCEPCIMCAAALAEVKIGRVVFGCCNDKFGGCGSVLSLQKYPTDEGVLKERAVQLLQKFYRRENFRAPSEKRKKKEGA